ncbi:hypothetical protein [Paractinoplanes toevensis]|nr:hypothetical protein [Actinoplanes toevensis]
MTDYDCFPLWLRGGAGPTNIDPATLPISAALAEELLAWADEYDDTLDRDDPLASGFADRDAELAFYAHGRELAHRLAGELGETVDYFDGPAARDERISP